MSTLESSDRVERSAVVMMMMMMTLTHSFAARRALQSKIGKLDHRPTGRRRGVGFQHLRV